MSTYKTNNGYMTFVEIDEYSLPNNDIKSVYEKCLEISDKEGVDLSAIEIESGTDYDTPYWYIEYSRPATEEEILKFEKDAEMQNKNRRKMYEDLKKEFEGGL